MTMTTMISRSIRTAMMKKKSLQRLMQQLSKHSASMGSQARGMATITASSPQGSNNNKWSNSTMYASSESDFTSSDRFVSTATASNHTTTQEQHSHSLSFASPESDFVDSSSSIQGGGALESFINFMTTTKPEWSHQFSFASPESDFIGQQARNDGTKPFQFEWSQQLSFTSPESDFVGRVGDDAITTHQAEEEWTKDFMYASPESDFVSAQSRQNDEDEQVWLERLLHLKWNHDNGMNHNNKNDAPPMMASPETSVGYTHMAETISPKLLQAYLEHQRDSMSLVDQNLVHVEVGQEHMPQTIAEALEDPRPIVITSMSSPFVVFDVNEAWTGLCGFSREEALDRKLGDLLQGPNTDTMAAQSMIDTLRETNYSEAILTNYTKQGRPFKNHIQVGKLSTSDGASDFFVGVLSEIGTELDHHSNENMSSSGRRQQHA